MNKHEIKSKLQTSKIKLDFNHSKNKLSDYIEQINEHVTEEKEREDRVANRRAGTLTNDEIAKTEYPIDDPNETYINIPNNLINKIKQELQDIHTLLSDLAESIPHQDSELHPESVKRMSSDINHARNEFDSLIFDGKNSQILIECKNINNSRNVSEEQLNEFKSAIDHEVKNINYVYRIIETTTVPKRVY